MINMESSGLTIGRLRIWDLPRFINLRDEIEKEATSFMPVDKSGRQEAFLYTLLKLLWRGDRMINLIAWEGERPVGFITVLFGRHHKFRGNAYIANVSVSKEMRGQGIGKILLQEAENLAYLRQARRVELEVFSKNIGAIELYKKVGYMVEGVKRRAIENHDGFDDLIFMAKLL